MRPQICATPKRGGLYFSIRGGVRPLRGRTPPRPLYNVPRALSPPIFPTPRMNFVRQFFFFFFFLPDELRPIFGSRKHCIPRTGRQGWRSTHGTSVMYHLFTRGLLCFQVNFLKGCSTFSHFSLFFIIFCTVRFAKHPKKTLYIFLLNRESYVWHPTISFTPFSTPSPTEKGQFSKSEPKKEFFF